MHNFITNNAGQKALRDRLNTLISVSEELKFLVGFFYFTGWKELYQSLKANPNVTLRVLVGLQVKQIEKLMVEAEEPSKNSSDDDRFDSFIQSLSKALNRDEIDNEEFYNQVEFFIEMIRTERLVIRKTKNPNHAKLYIFKLNEQQAVFQGTPGQFITGSSNLTSAGLVGQEEFNVEIRDYGFEDANAYYEYLWKDSAKLTEDESKRIKILDYIQNKTLATKVTPYEAYATVLKAYLDLQQDKKITPLTEGLLDRNGFKRFTYQIDAVNQGLNIIEEYKGVIIADVVGLGKSVIASLIAKSLDRRTLIICPPGLIGERLSGQSTGWWEYVDNFQLNCRVESRGRLADIAEGIDNYNPEVIIVDEAHYFRNQDTDDYEFLQMICRNRKVILLSATPFNNSPSDIFALLKLFIIPGKSGITIDNDLDVLFAGFGARFNKLSYILKYYADRDTDKKDKAKKHYCELVGELPIEIKKVKQETKKLANQIKNVISPVVIRRNRIDLKTDCQYKKEIAELSEVTPPKELFWELSEKQNQFYDKVITEYFGKEGRFKGAIYQPFKYEKYVDENKLDEEGNRAFIQQTNLFDFMRRLLVKRFESSFGAFNESISRFLDVHNRVVNFIQKTEGKYILDRKLMDVIIAEDNEDIIDILLSEFENNADNIKTPKHSIVYNTNKFVKKSEFFSDIKSDIALFTAILDEIKNLDLVSNDPKRENICFEIEALRVTDTRRKIIVFSEYVDTVKHLEPFFREKFGDKLLICDGKISKEMDRQLNANFNAQYRGAHEDRFDILVTSDKLSEGFNLNYAGAIINYDIPWNPTRVIQRIGRINRIGTKVFDKLFIYNCFPSQKGASVVAIREVAMQKMYLIHNALGEDAQIFDTEEEPTASKLYQKINESPGNDEEASSLTRIRNIYNDIAICYPEIIRKIANLPARIKSAKLSKENQLCVLRKKGLALFTHIIIDTKAQKKEVIEVSFEEFLSLIECEFSTQAISLSDLFWSSYNELRLGKKVHKRGRYIDKSRYGKAHKHLKVSLRILDPTQDELLFRFIRTLIEDIEEYKTLSDKTLAKLARNEITPDSTPQRMKSFYDQVNTIRLSLGDDYLEQMKLKVSTHKNEIVVAIENICYD